MMIRQPDGRLDVARRIECLRHHDLVRRGRCGTRLRPMVVLVGFRSKDCGTRWPSGLHAVLAWEELMIGSFKLWCEASGGHPA